MFLRSQSREQLVNMDQCLVEVKENAVRVYRLGSAIKLGVYENNRRAIEVLDEIQVAYLGCNRRDNKYMPTINTGVPQSSWIENTVFQMPEK